ncbi:hypothetical protein [Ornithinibacillus sp. JPR2-1]|uniref:hypothetical protein n=1 Tax=Ornithinibacillus sp. JPR2-1 TaxID=2094019 RepID=UPI0031D15574
MMKSRKERRAEARKNKTTFQPQYNGGGVKSFKEWFGKGYERFNSKHVTIREEGEQS